MALYWAKALQEQSDDAELQSIFSKLAATLSENEDKIVAELNDLQGKPVDIGGYYHPDSNLAVKALRPSQTLNKALASI